MKAKILHWLAIFLIIETGLIHYLTAQHEFEEAAYLGYLFIGNFGLALVAANGIYRQRRWGWILGLGLAVATLIGYAWSRTLGMPGMEIESWFTPWGLISLVVEGLFVGLAMVRLWRRMTVNDNLAGTSTGLRYALPVMLILALFLTNTLVYRWDAAAGETTPMQMLTVEQLDKIAPISAEELEQTYGVRIERVAISAMDSIVDVRVRIVDPEKVNNFFAIHPSLLVEDETLIFAPNMHSHAISKSQRIHILFFSTLNGLVHSGSEVNLVFGNVRLQPVIIQ